MRYRLVGIPASVLLIVLLSLANASAQSVSTAQINGTVKDQSGGGLPGVTVTVTQTDTGLTRTAITDESGSYIVQNLPVGPYRFEAELQGFRKFVQTGIVLEVNVGGPAEAGPHVRLKPAPTYVGAAFRRPKFRW
jgi:hypothetical protein